MQIGEHLGTNELYYDSCALLDAAGWLRIWDDGSTMLLNSWDGGRWRHQLTQAQLDALFDMALANPSMRDHLMKLLRDQSREVNGIELGGPYMITEMLWFDRVLEAKASF
jgi:hypothetical protein